jgi:uncharacterized coiled-coil protein SlyX
MDDKVEILQAINGVNETVIGLRQDMVHMRTQMEDLSRKVDRVEGDKASRLEIQAIEARLTVSIADGRASSRLELAEYRAQQKIDLDRMDKEKIGNDELSPENVDNRFDSLDERVDTVEKSVQVIEQERDAFKNKASGGWTVMQKVGVVISALIGAFAFLLHELISMAALRHKG